MTQRERYVLVEAQLQPRLVGGARRRATSTSPENAGDGGRARPARAPRAAGHHRHELPRDRLRRPAAAGAADRLDAGQHLHPERAVDGHGSSSTRRRRSSSGCTSSTSRARSTTSTKLLVTANDRDRRRSTRSGLQPSAETHARQARGDARPAAGEEAVRRGGGAASPSCAQTNAELKKTLGNPALAEAAGRRERRDRAGAHAGRRSQARASRSRTSSARWRASTGCSAAARQDLALDAREPAPDHRQPARPHRGREALSGQRASSARRRARWSARHDRSPRHAGHLQRGSRSRCCARRSPRAR